MAVSIELNEIANPDIRRVVQTVIQEAIGDRPDNEDWRVWIHSTSNYRRIVVRGPIQTRDRVFYEEAALLPQKIKDWLGAYPLR